MVTRPYFYHLADVMLEPGGGHMKWGVTKVSWLAH